jgi:hypothetical protein
MTSITRENLIIEITDAETGAIIVCDTFAHCVSCDLGLAGEADEIIAALGRGEFYTIRGGAAAGFVIQPAPIAAYAYAD